MNYSVYNFVTGERFRNFCLLKETKKWKKLIETWILTCCPSILFYLTFVVVTATTNISNTSQARVTVEARVRFGVLRVSVKIGYPTFVTKSAV